MKSSRLYTLVILLLTIFLGAEIYSSELPLYCPEPVWDFGRINERDKPRHTFTLENQSERSLIIEKIRASCGCTRIKPPAKSLIPPQSSFEIEAVFSPKNRRGQQAQTISIFFANRDPYRLRIEGYVQPLVWISPPILWMGTTPKTGLEKEVTLDFSIPTRLTGITHNLGATLTAEASTNLTGRAHLIKIATQPPYPQKKNRGTIMIQTDNRDVPKVEIPIHLLITELP